MRAPTHVAVSALVILAAAKAGLNVGNPVDYALAALGALLPDIDHPGSWIGRRFKLIAWPVTIVFGHRGITHSLLATAAVSAALLTQVAAAWTVPIGLGYLSHLLADYLTPAGIPLLYPSRKAFHCPTPIRTGGPGELAILMGSAAFLTYRLFF